MSEGLLNQEQQNPFETSELSEVDPDLIRDIEKSKLFEDSKVNLLLALSGLKPASEITMVVSDKIEGYSVQVLSPEDIESITSILKKSGLPFYIRNLTETYGDEREQKTTGKLIKRKRDLIEISISTTQENLNKLIETVEFKEKNRALSDEAGDDKEAKKEINSEYHRKLGLALGFPESAVEAFIDENKQMPFEDLPQEVRESDAVFFAPHVLSKEHWRQELEQGRIYAEFIEKVSPITYQEFLKFKKEKSLLETED